MGHQIDHGASGDEKRRKPNCDLKGRSLVLFVPNHILSFSGPCRS